MTTLGDIILAIAPYAIGAIVAFVGWLVFKFSRQQELLKFLGVDKQSSRVIIYLSSLFIPRGCAFGFDRQSRSYQGITIPIEELSVSSVLTKDLPVDAFENIPPFIRKPLKQKWSLFRPITVDVNASPLQESDIDFQTKSIVTVGGQGYNIVTNYCLRCNLTQLQIAQNGSAIQITKGIHKNEVIRAPSSLSKINLRIEPL